MFQCIVQPKNNHFGPGSNWTINRPELKDVFPDLRQQLSDQLRALDTRLDSQTSLLNELNDYFRRRSELELEYSKGLEKLSRSLSARHKEIRLKKDPASSLLPSFSLFNVWTHFMTETRKQSSERALISELYGSRLTARLTDTNEDLSRVHKLCRCILQSTHSELLKVLQELHTASKTYGSYAGEARAAKVKLQASEAQRAKLGNAKASARKLRLVDKEIGKRLNKWTESKFKSLKAKNEYILCLDAANAAVQKYFVEDVSDVIDCMDLGCYQTTARALNCYVSSVEELRKSMRSDMDGLTKCVNGLDSRADKQKFLELHNCFVMPKRFEFDGDEAPILETTSTGIRTELTQRQDTLAGRLQSLRTESDEIWKTLETAEGSLLKMLNLKDYDTHGYFMDPSSIRVPTTEPSVKLRSDRVETEEFHLEKFSEYVLATNRITRLQAKYDRIVRSMDTSDGCPTSAESPIKPRPSGAGLVTRRKRIGGGGLRSGQPKLFGGSLEEYVETTGVDIPLVLRSCIRVINLYGLHHQGLFRVSGSQVEISNIREGFERGEDPLANMNNANDINSVAGVLKLYLRELREPLFPIVYFDVLMEMAQLPSPAAFVTSIRELIKSMPRPIFIVLRYLFAFLSHLSEFSDENMMDPYNIAICFGPTLVPVPEDKDQVQYQNLVNELIKNIIIYSVEIFPSSDDVGGLTYEKFISVNVKEEEEEEEGQLDPHVDTSQDDIDSELYPSEEDSVFMSELRDSFDENGKSEPLVATAQYDFSARSPRELSLKRGDRVKLFSQVSADWWKGEVGGVQGLVPDKYIIMGRGEGERGSGGGKGSSSSGRGRTVSDSFLGPPGGGGGGQGSLSLPERSGSTSSTKFLTIGGGGGVGGAPEGIWTQLNNNSSSGHTRSRSAPEDGNGVGVQHGSDGEGRGGGQGQGSGGEPRPSTSSGSREGPGSSAMCLNFNISTPKSVDNESSPSRDGGVQEGSSSQEGQGHHGPSSESSFNKSTKFWESLRGSSEGGQGHLPITTATSGGVNNSSLKHTPDLVMDLPIGGLVVTEGSGGSSSSSSSSSSSGSTPTPESPLTGAECFAKQQCTLKKNSKNPLAGKNNKGEE